MAGSSSRRRILGLAVGLSVLQALAVATYFFVEGRREAKYEVPLRHERITDRSQLPNADVEARSGRVRSIRALGGRPLLLHFWATWCPPCREELPALLALGDRGDIEVVAISVDDDWLAVDRFFGGKVPPEVFRDPSGVLERYYEVTTLPDSYLLDSAGSPIARFAGPRSWGSDTAAETLDALVASGGRDVP